MTPNPAIMKSVENLGYRVTVGDVASQAGLEVNLAQQGLLALASDAGGHLQVADSGEIVYLFPQNFRGILRNKFWRLRLQEWWEKVWQVLFYLIRISFGIILIAFIVIVTVAIIAILMASNRDDDNNSGSSRSNDGGGGFFFFPTNIFWIFNPGYGYNRYEYEYESPGKTKASQIKPQMNFLEAIFSFLFGDGNPNFNLEERRWQEIGAVIRNQGGAVIAQQIAPYLDNIDRYNQENEDYIIPVLARFNGYPEVSPQGEIIYYFPELQVKAKKRSLQSVSSYLREKLWRFSEADTGQITLSAGLGVVYLGLTLYLGSLLHHSLVAGSFLLWVNSIYGVFLGYAVAFLTIPLLRYFWIQWKNSKISSRNQQRQNRVEWLQQGDSNLQQKLDYARQFASEKIITDADITYSTEQELLEQEIERSDKIDQEWQRRLELGD